jgi:hypothetical protein
MCLFPIILLNVRSFRLRFKVVNLSYKLCMLSRRSVVKKKKMSPNY